MVHRASGFGFRGALVIASALVLATGGRGTLADLVNVAPLGTATQSTEWPGYPATNGIDGNYANFTHTGIPDAAPTWQVDLRVERAIQKIVLYNRSDCCPERLRDITVSILEADGTTVNYASAILNLENELGGPPTIEIDLALEEGGPISGQIVRVERAPDPTGGLDETDATVISLGEVEVLVDSATLPPAIQTHPAGGRKYIGGCHVFSVTLFNAENAASVTYEWTKDDVKLSGETGPRLIRGNLQATDSGTYKVIVKVDATTLTSDPAVLVVAGKNLAPAGVATQSSTAFGGTPERAIDGNTSGFWADASITHTDNLPGSWWQVELHGTSTVDTVVIWNRSSLDCCPERLSNIRVSALDGGGTEVWGEDYFTDLTFPDPSFEVEMGGVECRIIKVERLGPDGSTPTPLNYLSLAEVEVLGEGPLPPPDPRPNIARACGTLATQSSQAGTYAPGLAIDGLLNTFTHTLAGNGGLGPATWQVDLVSEQDLALIVLHNRVDCCGSRLRDITVSILDATEDLVWQSDLLNPENELGVFPLGPAELRVNIIELEGGPVKGQFVRVTREPDPDFSGGGDGSNLDEADVISLSEVEVYAYPADCPATGDTHCQGLAVEGPDDSYPGLYTFTATTSDESGDPVLHTFTLSNGIDPPTVVGPRESNILQTRLGPGEWTVTLAVDDDPICIDKAANATCTQTFEVIDVENIALLGVATQSSEYQGGIYPASLAIDGNYDDFTHTIAGTSDPDPTWELDLLSEKTIGRIVLHNRTSCCGSRLRDITVSILDLDREIVYQSALINPENEMGVYPDGPPTLTVDIEKEEGGGLAGKYVRVHRLPDPDLSGTGGQGNDGEYAVLSLGEVQVFPASGVVVKPRFRRADPNDDGTINITDGIYVLNFLFLGGPKPTCQESANPNDDASVNITDGIYILNYLFLGGPAPAAPGTATCGPDPAGSPSDLGCEEYTHC